MRPAIIESPSRVLSAFDMSEPILPLPPSPPIRQALDNLLARAGEMLKQPKLGRDVIDLWVVAVRNQLEKIYGKGTAPLLEFPILPAVVAPDQIHKTLQLRVEHVQRIIESLDALPARTKTATGKRVFIGHGRSPLWRELKDFISDRLGLSWDEFNREPVAGFTTSARLEEMLNQAGFALLVMTAEEERGDSTLHARPNVIHEVGLFQGRLGISRAIVLLEDGCSEFSNINGLVQIRFPRGDIAARFEEIRRVLEREGFL